MTAKKTTAQEVREVEADHAGQLLATRLAAIGAIVPDLEADPTLAAEGLPDLELADAIATIQDTRARLMNVERDLATALGKRSGKTVGTLSDGRQFKLERATDRKEWEHDEWKRDARRAVANAVTGRVEAVGPLVNMETGEEVTLGRVLQEAMTAIQEVHGATSPKSTSLKALGLYASDYCSSSPSGWRFSAIKPTPKADTTPTTEEPTNG